MESDRESFLKKGYIKIFVLSILLLIVGIIIIAIGNIWATIIDEKIDTPWEYEAFFDTLIILGTLAISFLQFGMVIFSFSAFMGAVVDNTLSDGIRRGMVYASIIAIVGLVLITIFQGFIITF